MARKYAFKAANKFWDILSLLSFTIFFLITAAFFFNIVSASPVLGIILEIVIFLGYVHIIKSAIDAYVCLVHSEGLDLPRPRSGDIHGSTTIDTTFTPIDWELITTVTIKKSLLGTSLLISAYYDQDKTSIHTYRIPWPLECPEEFKSKIYEYAPSNNPLVSFISRPDFKD